MRYLMQLNNLCRNNKILINLNTKTEAAYFFVSINLTAWGNTRLSNSTATAYARSLSDTERPALVRFEADWE